MYMVHLVECTIVVYYSMWKITISTSARPLLSTAAADAEPRDVNLMYRGGSSCNSSRSTPMLAGSGFDLILGKRCSTSTVYLPYLLCIDFRHENEHLGYIYFFFSRTNNFYICNCWEIKYLDRIFFVTL